MFTRYTTESGSHFDVDRANGLVRRLSSSGTAMRATMEWKPFTSAEPVDFSDGQRLLIVWTGAEPPLEEGPDVYVPTTLSSRIVDTTLFTGGLGLS